jgi:hypothetical protein
VVVLVQVGVVRSGGGGDGKQRVCCARRGCGEDGQKRCGGCKQVGAE